MVFPTIHLIIGLSTHIGPPPPQIDDSPAERCVLSKLALGREKQNGPLVRLLLHQGLRERDPALVELVAQVELLSYMAERNLIRLQPSERSRIRALSAKTDELILRRSSFVLAALHREYQIIAATALNRAAGRRVPRR